MIKHSKKEEVISIKQNRKGQGTNLYSFMFLTLMSQSYATKPNMLGLHATKQALICSVTSTAKIRQIHSGTPNTHHKD